MPISLVTDSTSDLPADYAQAHNITVVPSLLVMGGKTYRDGVDISREDYYRQLATINPLPTTATPASGEFEAAFRACPDGPVISIHTASTLSGLYNAARLGGEAVGDRVTVLDSGSLSLGVGMQLMAAAKAIESNQPLEGVLAAITATQQRLKVYALLNTIDNLRRSGRMSLLKASIASVLQIKPTIELSGGKLVAVAQNRTLKKAMADFIERVRAHGKLERLGIMYTDNVTMAHELRDALANQCASPPLVTQAAPTIGTHIGPNAVAVAVVKFE